MFPGRFNSQFAILLGRTERFWKHPRLPTKFICGEAAALDFELWALGFELKKSFELKKFIFLQKPLDFFLKR